MLNFSVPQVDANAARVDAFVTFLICLIALLGFPYPLFVLPVLGLVRGFWGHQRCPVHRATAGLLRARGWAGHKENAGPKMFASKLLFIASTAAVVLLLTGSALWKVPAAVLLVFSFMEWAFSFCAACWAYTLWYRAFPPAAK